MRLSKVNFLWRGLFAWVLTAVCAVEAKTLPETLVLTQAQFYPIREQARGYLGRYLNQPLLVDPDLPVDPDQSGIDPLKGWGSFPSQADYNLTIETVKSYGFDGVGFFVGMRHPRFVSAGSRCPVDDYLSVPIVMWRDPLDDFDKALDTAGLILKNVQNCRIGGKVLVLSYWTDNGRNGTTPEEFKKKCDLIRAKYGDKFLFAAALTKLRTIRDRKQREKYVREWARVADGIQIADLNATWTIEKSERVVFSELIREEYAAVRKVLSEQEFVGRKLFVGSAVNGHMNAYMKGYGLLEDGTRTLRETFGIALENDCDVVLLPEWDEYNENTSFAPTLYDSWTVKRISRYFVARMKCRPLEKITSDDDSLPNLILSYRKCISPGERLTIEVLNVPDGSRSGPISVEVGILNDEGKVVRTLPVKLLDEAKLEEARYELDTVELAAVARALRMRLQWTKEGVTRMLEDGFHPVDIAPANTWNHLAVRQPIRDLAFPVKCEIRKDGSRMSANFISDEPIRYAMLCGNGCIQYVQGRPGSSVERFRESEERAAFQISPVCVGRHKAKDRPFVYRVRGAESAEWMYIGAVGKGESFSVDEINGHGTPPIYLSLPKSELKGKVLDVEYPDLPFQAEIPLDVAFERRAYSVGTSMKAMQVTVARFPLQARYPSVANAKVVSFSVDCDADRNSMMYHVQFVTMSGKTWFSRPFVEEAKDPSGKIRVWNAMKEKSETFSLPSARIPSVRFDFSPVMGNVVGNQGNERHWFGMLGGPYSSANLWNRGARTEGAVDKPCAAALNEAVSSVPGCVREPDGSWSLEFDGVDDFANVPCELWPTFGGCTVEMDVRPETNMTHRGSLWANRFGLFDLGVLADGTMQVGFHSMGKERMDVKDGPRLSLGEWNHVKIVSDADRLTLYVNDVDPVCMPIQMPALNTMGVMIGGYPDKSVDRGFFRGRIRNLRVDHSHAGR